MSGNSQFDYSTLSTSFSRSELSTIQHIVDAYDAVEEDERSEEASQSSEIVLPPRDRYHMVYITFGLLGVATLLPWNFFITANDYWMYKFRSLDSSNGSCSLYHNKTALQAAFTSYIAVAFNVPYVVILMICSFLPTPKISRVSQVVAPLMLLFGSFAVVTALVECDTDNWQMGFFALTLAIIVIVGAFTAVLQASVAGIAGLLPPSYTHAMIIGQCLAGIVSTLASIASLLGHCDSISSALGYFLAAVLIILVAIGAYIAASSTICECSPTRKRRVAAFCERWRWAHAWRNYVVCGTVHTLVAKEATLAAICSFQIGTHLTMLP